MNTKNIEVALFEPQIPANTGTILRTASCFNLRVNIILPCGFVFNSGAFKRSGMDYTASAKYSLFDSWDDFKKQQSAQNKRIILVTTKATTSYYNFTYQEADILLFGNETRGVSKEMYKEINSQITIPMAAGKRSLNLAVSVGIVAAAAING